MSQSPDLNRFCMTQRGEVFFGLPLPGVPDVHDLIVSGKLAKALALCSKGVGDRVLDGARSDDLSQKIPIPLYFRKSKTWSGHRIRKRMKFQGLDVSIENPAGSYRQGTDADGKPWRSLLHFDYGYILGTTGIDKDHVDCFIGPYKDSTRVFVVHQKNVKTGAYDEDKVMLGWRTKKAAIRDYLKNYNRSDQVMGVTRMTIGTFKTKAAATKKNPMMIKAVVRAHPRRVKSGKVVQVREHQTRRAKRKDVGFRYISGDFGTTRILEMYRLSDGSVLMQIDPFGGGIPVDPKRRAARLKKMAQELWAYYEKVHMKKSTIRAHARRTKGGKVIRVREHQTSKTKMPERPAAQRPAPAPEPETITDLFGEAPDGKTVVTTEEIPIAAISRDPTQPREHFDKKKLQELGQSIKKLGLLQDIAIRPDPDNEDRYIMIAGERRWRAMQIIGEELTSAKVYHTADPKEIASIQVAENVGRVQMNPMEEARAFQKLQDAGYTLEEVATRAGTSQTTVERRIGFLDLIPSLQEMVKTGALSVRRAEIIAGGNLRSQYQQNIVRRLNAGQISRSALRGMVGKYQTAQTQTMIFAPEESAIDQRITHQRRKSLERDLNTLLNDFGDLMGRIGEKGGAKIIPALAKEKGKLATVARKVSMITDDMKKIDREMQYALKYFEAGGRIDGYLTSRSVKPQKKVRRKVRKAITGEA